MKNQLSWSKFKLTKPYLIIIGLTATLWFLIRVIPKPSRAGYPCMKAAAPLMSTFVIYLIGVSASVFSFNKMKQAFQSSRYLVASLFLFISIMSFGVIFLNNSKDSLASMLSPMDDTFPIASNEPIGVAQGMFPGRVVWVHNDDATNENYDPQDAGNDWWYSNNNANETVIKAMLTESLKKYTNTNSSEEAWDAIFKSYNKAHGFGEVGYNSTEKIAIKINLTNQCCTSAERMDATPQLVNAVLNELITYAKVPAANITCGDPYREFRAEYVDLVMGEFPQVNFVGGNSGNGVVKTVPSADMVLKFSDKDMESSLPQYYIDAKYFINIPCLKTHDDGGITLIAKNHQGSYLEKGMSASGQSAFYMHKYLPTSSPGSGNYRHTVDYMGHEETGGKALIYIIDGIWGGDSWQGWISKYASAPFNNDYPNSIFVGQDPVALESVGFDILFEENVQASDKGKYPIDLKFEIADYLSQCASSDYWPAGLEYDPEGDGTPIESLGVFEHWNNATDRQYSRNLGTGDGIELIYYKSTGTSILTKSSQELNIASPNPFADYTEFRIPKNIAPNTDITIFNIKGELIKTLKTSGSEFISWNGTNSENVNVANGLYIYKISNNTSNIVFTGKVMLQR